MRWLARSAAFFLALAASCGSAFAYYDDTHYALTYYIARQTGYTAVQSHRIASVCSQVDYDEDTEPVQAFGQLLSVATPFDSKAQAPRFKFHAMRDDREHSHAVGHGEDAGVAQNAVSKQLDALFQDALNNTKNPGVFLHAFQDEKPHHGYGTAWGHWPIYVGAVEEYGKHGLPIGGTTDWISHREFDVVTLAEKCSSYLRQFMEKVSPHQLFKPYQEQDMSRVVASLARVNPAPAPLDTELKRTQYVQFYAETAKLFGGQAHLRTYGSRFADSTEMTKLAQDLGIGINKADFIKHLEGPDLKKAIAQIDLALKSHGLSDMVPMQPIEFDLDSDGELADDLRADQWTLTGSLTFSVTGSKGTATIKMPKQGSNANEYALHGISPVAMQPNQPHTWEDLPVGELIIEIQTPDGKVHRQPVELLKRETTIDPIKLTEAEDPNKGKGRAWILKAININNGEVGSGPVTAPFSASPGGASYEDPAGKMNGSVAWNGLPAVLYENGEYTISLRAKNMIGEFQSRTAGAKDISQGVRDPWDPPANSRTFTFKFEPEMASASNRAQARGQVFFLFWARALSDAHHGRGPRVIYVYEPGDPKDAIQLPPGIGDPVTGGGNPPITGGGNPPITGGGNPTTGGGNPPTGGTPPAFNPSSWEVLGEFKTSGASIIMEVPDSGSGNAEGFSKTAISGDVELVIDYTMTGHDSGNITLDFCLFTSPGSDATGGVFLSRQDNGSERLIYLLPQSGGSAESKRLNTNAANGGKVRLVRKGSTITAYQSDGDSWTEVAKLEIDLPKDLYFGFSLFRQDGEGSLKITATPTMKPG